MEKSNQRIRAFIIPVTVAIAGDLVPVKFKIPAEFILIDGYAITHDHYNAALSEDDELPQIGELRVSLNNGSSHSISSAVSDQPGDALSKKIEYQPLAEPMQPGEYVEGFYNDFAAIGAFKLKIYLKGIIQF
jgi:hypothetical protein